MKLTGKCKEAFEKWSDNVLYPFHIVGVYKGAFWDCPDSMQYGVYVDFFDSVNMSIGCRRQSLHWFVSYAYVDEFRCNTRQEARARAIEKANEIYNESN